MLACLGVVFLAERSPAHSEIDFSSCGYRQSGQAIPIVPIRVVVTAEGRDDDRPHIQAAIDHVSRLQPDRDGFRGAILLQGGPFVVRGSLVIKTPGVVLRGSGVEKTSLRGRDVSRAPIIRVIGRADLAVHEIPRRVVDESVPAGGDPVVRRQRRGVRGRRLHPDHPTQ